MNSGKASGEVKRRIAESELPPPAEMKASRGDPQLRLFSTVMEYILKAGGENPGPGHVTTSEEKAESNCSECVLLEFNSSASQSLPHPPG